VETSPFERLSDGQRACLRLIYERREIKDIARELGIAPVTVNQRLTAARRHLRVSRSVDAARLLVEFEREQGVYNPPIYSPTSVEPAADRGPSSDRQDEGMRQPGIPLPFPTQRRPRNDLSFGRKLITAVILAALIALIFGGGVAALAGLSELF